MHIHNQYYVDEYVFKITEKRFEDVLIYLYRTGTIL